MGEDRDLLSHRQSISRHFACQDTASSHDVDGLKLLYYGPSMYPTLRPGDILYIRPYGPEVIRAGDVVTFVRPDGARALAHRVAFIDEGGIATRGDRNSAVDSGRLRPENIIGRVEYLKRGNRLLKMHGGLAGRARAASLRSWRWISQFGTSRLRPAYDLCTRSALLSKLPDTFMRPRVVSFLKGKDEELHLMMRGRLVGRLRAGDKQWRIRRLWRLFVDETRLPRHPGDL